MAIFESAKKLLSRDMLMATKKLTRPAKLLARLFGWVNNSNSLDCRDQAIEDQEVVIRDLRQKYTAARRQIEALMGQNEGDDGEKTPLEV